MPLLVAALRMSFFLALDITWPILMLLWSQEERKTGPVQNRLGG